MRWPVPMLIALVALVLIPGILPATAGEEEPDRVRLLVECDRETAEKVKAALAGLPVEISELRKTEPSPSPEATPAPATYAGLPSAAEVMTRFYGAVSKAPREERGAFLRIERMNVYPRRVTVTLMADDSETIDGVRKAVSNDPYFKGRARNPAAVVEMGSISRQGPHLKAQMTVSFRTDDDVRAGARRASSHDGIPLIKMQQFSNAAAMQLVRASPERHDQYRSAGIVEISQEYAYAETNLKNLTTLLHNIENVGKLTVFELRWQLQDDKHNAQPPYDKIRKPTIKVGYWAPLER